MRKKIEAAVGIIFNQSSHILMAERPKSKTWSGWWEFPGGKIELGESSLHALIRELKEEIGIVVHDAEKWIIRKYAYDNYDVTLHFYKVTKWSGKVEAKEQQRLSWVIPKQKLVTPVLPANELIFKAIPLPDVYAITNAFEYAGDFLEQLKKKLNDGVKLLQIREKSMSKKNYVEFCKKIIHIAKNFNAKVLINSDIELAYKLDADGVHLNSLLLNNLSDIPKDLIVAASCHSKKDIEKTIELGVDFAVLSPVQQTQSHPHAAHLGWESFGDTIQNFNIPIYALGGMQRNDINNAFNAGGVGIASQRSIWNT